MNWNFDIEAIPRDGQKLWIETSKGQVLISWCARKSPHNRKGGFVNVQSEDEIIAWQPYLLPVPSGFGRRMPVTRYATVPGADCLPIIEDVGSV